jgi:signal transduction histidine kinase
MADTVLDGIRTTIDDKQKNPVGRRAGKPTRHRILYRTMSMAWYIVIFTVAIFVVSVIPYQRRQLVAEMCQRAMVVYTSTAQMAVESIVMDDFSIVVDHCMSIVNQNPSILYIVITRKDGFSLVHRKGAWRQENLKGAWQPSVRRILGQGRFIENPLTKGRTFQLSYAVDYLGLEWGWIHLGLSTNKFHTEVRTLYLQLGIIAAVAISAGFLLSLIYARRLSIPILKLERFARRIAAGDLSQRIDIGTGDEIEQLAHSFNYMMDTLQQAKREGKIAQQKLVETARQAGMAEMVSNVLHNVGNVLNSVGVTTSIMQQRIAKSKIGSLSDITALVEEQKDTLGEYLTRDSQGCKVFVYLCSLSHRLVKEQHDFTNDLKSLERHVQLVRNIIHLQQDYSRTRGLTESVHMETVIEDAIQLNCEQITKYGIGVEKDYVSLPECWLDRHKLLQILINLFSNACHAVMVNEAGTRMIRVALKRTKTSQVGIEVSDNGMGIDPDNLTRIFQHGFTTRADGHGFGLHSSAIAAAELGGSLRAESEGIKKGATFIIELPFCPKEESNGFE